MGGLSGLVSNLFGSVSGKPQVATPSNVYSQAQPFYQDAIQQLFANSGNLNPALQQATQMAMGGPQGYGFMQGAQGAYGQGQNFLGQIPGQINQANSYFNQASGNINQGTNPITAQQIGDQTNQMMSPYTGNVIGSLQNAYNDQLNYLNSQNNSNSTLAGAFGSDRAALQQGQNVLNTSRGFNEQAGNLLNSAYQTASTNALNNLTNDRNRFLQAAGLNIGQGTGALSGANAYSQAANGASNLGQGFLQGANQNQSNLNNRINNLTTVGGIPNNQLQQAVQYGTPAFQSLQGGQAYTPQGLFGGGGNALSSIGTIASMFL